MCLTARIVNVLSNSLQDIPVFKTKKVKKGGQVFQREQKLLDRDSLNAGPGGNESLIVGLVNHSDQRGNTTKSRVS